MTFTKRIEHYEIEDHLEEQGKKYTRRFWPRHHLARWYDVSSREPSFPLPRDVAEPLEKLYTNLMLKKVDL